jgi:GT2 family glycosyltransferase
VLEGAVDRLVSFARARPEAKIWGGRTIFGDGKLNPSSCWRRMTLWSVFCATTGLTKLFRQSALFNPEAYPGWPRDSVCAVDIVTGCFLLIRRSFWEALGGFDPAYFVYGEEADLCLRAHELGAKPMITPDAVIVHHEGQSTPAKANHAVKLLAGKIRLAGTHLDGWQRPVARTLLRSGPVVRSNLYSVAATLRPSIAAKARMWREVMDRRDEWWRGYE